MSRMKASDYKQTAREAQIQKACCDLLDLLRIPYTVSDASRVWGRDGKPRRGKVRRSWPDLSMVLPGGRAGFAEIKTATGAFRPGQREMIRILAEAGAFVCTPRSIEEFASCLKLAGIRHKIIDELLKDKKWTLTKPSP